MTEREGSEPQLTPVELNQKLLAIYQLIPQPLGPYDDIPEEVRSTRGEMQEFLEAQIENRVDAMGKRLNSETKDEMARKMSELLMSSFVTDTCKEFLVADFEQSFVSGIKSDIDITALDVYRRAPARLEMNDETGGIFNPERAEVIERMLFNDALFIHTVMTEQNSPESLRKYRIMQTPTGKRDILLERWNSAFSETYGYEPREE